MEQRYRSFEIPGAPETEVEGISDSGTLAGTYQGDDFHYHGFVATPRRPVNRTINGSDGPVPIDRSRPLEVHVSLDLGPLASLSRGVVYIDVLAPSGLVWLDMDTLTFKSQPTRAWREVSSVS